MIRMKIVLTAVGGMLIGPFAGYHGMYWLSSLGSHHDCWWRTGAFVGSIFFGVPIGVVTFGLIGFWVGYLLDKRAKRRRSNEGGPPFGA